MGPTDDEAIKNFLWRLPLFAGVNDAELARLLAGSQILAIPAGSLLLHEGDIGDALYVILDGEFTITKQAGHTDLFLDTRTSGQMLGEIALLEQTVRMASARATRDSRVLKIGQAMFEGLIMGSPAALREVLRTTAARLRNSETMLHQNEKLAALGAIAAGLAHELNNPAAALKRGAFLLAGASEEWERVTVALERARSAMNEQQSTVLDRLRGMMEADQSAARALSPLQRSDRESELQAHLEAQGVDSAWQLAPLLVSAGWSVETLDENLRSFSSDQRRAVVRWLAAGCSLSALLRDLSMSADRISELVKAVKSYTYLDQAPVQNVDIHRGLDDTLVILQHKLQPGITVKKEYAPNLPHIEAYGSELNQVWTNLIDNAIDALDGRGEITLRTASGEDSVEVEICDSGPGIPAEIQRRIFEPFFTTKPQGVGTGLGLHMVRNIISAHHGQITLLSQPGATCFRVTLPRTLRS
jgi:signal transduction histidine kinase